MCPSGVNHKIHYQMFSNRFASKVAPVVSSIFALGGIILSVVLLVHSFSGGFDWREFLQAVLYLFCFVTLIAYSVSSSVKSPFAFRSVLVSYGIVLLVTGLLFPPLFPIRLKAIFLAFPVLLIMVLLSFDYFAGDVKTARIFLICAFIYETGLAFTSFFYSQNVLDGGTPEVLSLFIRPVILGSFTFCYLSRMRKRAAEIQN